MQTDILIWLGPLAVGVIAGVVALVSGILMARRTRETTKRRAAEWLAEAEAEAEAKQQEILVQAREQSLAFEEDADRRERELEETETRLDERGRQLDTAASELGRERKRAEKILTGAEKRAEAARAAEEQAQAKLAEARATLERVAGMTAEQARKELIADLEKQAREEAARIARKIEDEARENAERAATDFMVRAAQRVHLDEVLESTVSFIELPSDEMKGRIIGREGRNIRSLEMTTGIDLIVDDTPRSILISSFDPIRREVAKVAIHRLVEDGRIHPARIEEVVQKVAEEMDDMIDEAGNEAAYSLGISDLHPRLVRMVGTLRYNTCHGQNLLQHCVETAMIAGHMAREIGVSVETIQRAALLHEIGQLESSGTTPPILASAELSAKYGETDDVVELIRSLDRDVEPRGPAPILLEVANRMSESRPGARKENLAVFIERLRRLEAIAGEVPGVNRAFAVKAGKELRVLVDADAADDRQAHKICRQIAKTVEKELSYPGQIKVSVIRETRAVHFAV